MSLNANTHANNLIAQPLVKSRQTLGHCRLLRAQMSTEGIRVSACQTRKTCRNGSLRGESNIHCPSRSGISRYEAFPASNLAPSGASRLPGPKKSGKPKSVMYGGVLTLCCLPAAARPFRETISSASRVIAAKLA